MENLIYTVFDYLTDVPVNFWFWFLLFTAPVLVFSVKPEVSVKIRFLRLFFAVGCTFVLINLALHTSRALDWKDYHECQRNSIHREMSLEMEAECGHHINIADGASNIFYAFLGWIPAMVYVGWWEILWIRYHTRYTGRIKDNYKNSLASKSLIRFSKIFTAIIFTWLGLIVSGILLSTELNGFMSILESLCS